ncbi:MAG: dTMP kinase [Myxococcales bacterium]|nr:dTMP kinase [Myxococcales bacterium]
MSGLFIAIEGLDGAGTTTQTDLLTQWLAGMGKPCHRTNEPSRGPIGVLIREFLAGHNAPADPDALALLFAADRMDHLRREIRPALDAGMIVVSDRYVLSSLAYQGRQGNLSWVRELNSRATVPDVVIFLEVGVSTCLTRLQSRGTTQDIYENEGVLTAVYDGYQAALAATPSDSVVILDGEQAPTAVFEAIKKVVLSRL